MHEIIDGETHNEKKQEKPQQKKESIQLLNGHFYKEDGTFEGKIDEKEYKGSVNDVYTCKGIEKKKDENDEEIEVYTGIKLLQENGKNITHSNFITRASIVYGESSAFRTNEITEELKHEMFAIAYVCKVNKKAYGGISEIAKLFLNTIPEKRNNTKMQLAIAAVINEKLNGYDYSCGANMWDGQEQAMYKDSDKRFSTGSFELHKNTIGWRISDSHYKKWKENIGSVFKAPQESFTPIVKTTRKYYQPNTIRLESTAVYCGTIFWKELKGKSIIKGLSTTKEKTL